MNHFRPDLGPLPRIFWERELEQVLRADRQGYAKARCVLHQPDKHPSLSVNLRHGGFRCHGCQASGDMYKFVMLRYNCDFKTACKRLGAWDDRSSSAESQHEIERQQCERDRLKAAAEKSRSEQKTLRVEARERLHLYDRLYRQTAEHLTQLGIANTTAEVESCWSVLALTLPEIRWETATYDLLAFGSVEDRSRFTLNEAAREEMVTATINQGLVRDENGHVMEADFG